MNQKENHASAHQHSPEVRIRIIEIDIQHHCDHKLPHPKKDPGVQFVYLFNVDGKQFKTEKEKIKGHEIMALVHRSPDQYILQQMMHGHLHPVEPKEIVDLSCPGIEFFQTDKNDYNNG